MVEFNGPTQWEDHKIGKKHRKNTQKNSNPATAVPIAKQPQDAQVKGQKQQQQTSSKPSKSSSKASDAASASGGDAGGEPTAEDPGRSYASGTGSLAAMEQQEPSRAARTTAAPGLAADLAAGGGGGGGASGLAAAGGGGGSSGTGQWTSNFNQGGGGQTGNQQYQAYVLWPAGWRPEPGWDNGGGTYVSDGEYNWYATPWPGSRHQ